MIAKAPWARTQGGYQGRHDNGAQTDFSAFQNNFIKVIYACLFEPVEFGNQNNSIENGDAKQRNKSNAGGNTKRHVAEPERENSPYGGKWDGCINQQSLTD